MGYIICNRCGRISYTASSVGTVRCAYCGEPMELSPWEVRRFPQEQSASQNGDSKQKERLFRKKGDPYPWPFDPRD